MGQHGVGSIADGGAAAATQLRVTVSPTTRKLAYGGLGGAIGAACMTALRMAARRRGMIQKTVSQAAEEWLARRTGAHVLNEPVVHHVADQALHWGYGAALGAAYGLVARGRRASGLGGGALFGAATWVVGSWLLMPLLGVKRPAWRKNVAENAVDLGAHLLFGVTTALAVDQLSRQPGHGRTPESVRRALRTG
jgi:hypothetical protein